MSRKGWLLFIALCVVWGIPYLFIRIAVRELPPPALVLLRTAPAALLLLPFALRRGELRRVLRSWPWVLLYTGIELCVPWLLLAHAEQRISSSLAGLLIATVPLIGAVAYRAGNGGALPAAPFSPDVLGADVREACAGQRVMPYAVPTSTAGTEYAITSLDSKGLPSFFVANSRGSGAFVSNSDDSVCGSQGCKLRFLRWSAWGL